MKDIYPRNLTLKRVRANLAFLVPLLLLSSSDLMADEAFSWIPATKSSPAAALLTEDAGVQGVDWKSLKYHRDQDSQSTAPLSIDFRLAANSYPPSPVNRQSVSEESDGSSTEEMDEEAMIAEAMLNPLSYLWMLFTQNDTIWYDGDTVDALGEDKLVQNSTLIMPVLSVQLTDTWKTIIRPVIPINSFETVDNLNVSIDNTGPEIGADLQRETGLGDIVLWTAFSNQYTAPYIWGFGPTIMLDTASDDQLGTGKNSAGPMALAFNISDKWVYGAIAQHWWSFSGDDNFKIDTDLGARTVDRPDVNLTDVQPVLRYRYSALTNIGAAPNWRYNWETDQLSLPLGIGFDTMIKLGPVPTKVGAEVYYYAEKDDDFGPDWQLRILFVPVLPSPNWARNGLF